eukprot:TRINITY_DN1413_c0_g2_i1.p1 TRINITY_DN1413_c0_g2~~TRINITY_DN1413_c0_g2_i1.p1  ORF type:complete len:202 (-),score=61.49 TRINITY_DN1413_c0_g2_i1:25-567(-)
MDTAPPPPPSSGPQPPPPAAPSTTTTATKPSWRQQQQQQQPVKLSWQDQYPIHYTANVGDVSALSALIAKQRTTSAEQIGAVCSAPDNDSWTPLHYAAWYDQLAAVKVLVEEGEANVNATTDTGSTPLHLAAGTGRAAVVEYLLSKGANRNPVDKERKTPLLLCNELQQGDWSKVVSLLS